MNRTIARLLGRLGLHTDADVEAAYFNGLCVSADAHRAHVAALKDRTNTLAEQLRAVRATLDQVDPFRLRRTMMGVS